MVLITRNQNKGFEPTISGCSGANSVKCGDLMQYLSYILPEPNCQIPTRSSQVLTEDFQSNISKPEIDSISEK